MENEKWAELKANKFREKREANQTEEKIRLLEDQQKKDAAPRLWKDFCVSLEGKIKAFNSALGEEAVQIERPEVNKVVVGINDFITKISAEFKFVALELDCMLVSTSTEYHLMVPGDTVSFARGSRNQRRAGYGAALSAADVAEEFLNNIIEFVG